MDVSVLMWKTLKSVDIDDYLSEIVWTCEDGTKYKMFHDQDCCESVTIEDICGNIEDLVGSPILMAEEEINSDAPKNEDDDSFTWSFYRFATAKGYVNIRWYGASSGHYSERVNFEIIEEHKKINSQTTGYRAFSDVRKELKLDPSAYSSKDFTMYEMIEIRKGLIADTNLVLSPDCRDKRNVTPRKK